jgi:predicted ester cyclase
LAREGVSRVRAAAGQVVAAGRARVGTPSERAGQPGAPAGLDTPAGPSAPAGPPVPPVPPALEPPPTAAAQVAASYVAAVDAHDLDAAAALCHPEIVEDSPTGLRRGPDEVRAELAGLIAAMPDFSLRPLGFLAEGDFAVVRWWASGTHSGAKLQGLRASGARLGLAGADLIEVRDDAVVSNAVYYDTATVARQLGALPARGSGQERFLIASANAVTRVRDQAKAVSSWMTERLR